MTELISWFDQSLTRWGEPITVDGVGTQALVRAISPAEARVWLDTAPVDAASRPIRGFFIASSVVAAVGDEITWQSQTWTIQAIREYRLSGSVLTKMLLAWV